MSVSSRWYVVGTAVPFSFTKFHMMLASKSLDTRDALRAAAQSGSMETVRFLVQEGVNNDDADNDGYTPLIYADRGGHVVMAQYLLDQGADIEKTNFEGCSSFFYAAYKGHLPMTTYLPPTMAEVRFIL